MERYKVTLAYDGTHFEGFQRQGQHRTVQLELESTLRKLNWQGRAVLSSGRTDSGVHADGQVAAFDLEWNHSTEALGKALNANLPKDVAVKAVEVAPATFHPRYDARRRCYHYHLLFAPMRDPLRERFAWRIATPCDRELLQTAAGLLPGVHDFAAFGTPPREGGSTIRQVFETGWTAKEEGMLRFHVIANAFLYHMVRRMVYVVLQVGQGRMSLSQLQAAVEQAQPMPAGLAPPQGLVLKEVQYE